jgi:hypothetical protein
MEHPPDLRRRPPLSPSTAQRSTDVRALPEWHGRGRGWGPTQQHQVFSGLTGSKPAASARIPATTSGPVGANSGSAGYLNIDHVE